MASVAPYLRVAACGLLVLACLGAAAPLHAVSMAAADPGAARAAAQDVVRVQARPIDARYLQLDTDAELRNEVTDPAAARRPHAMDEALRQAGRDGASPLEAAAPELAGIVIPDLALGEAPLVEYSDGRDSGPSVLDVLRSVVTVTGGSGSTHAATAGSAARGDGFVLGALQPLAVELLELGLTDRRNIDGTVVFSILGRGAFVLEAARDGSGVMLSELGSGFGITLGANAPTRQPPGTPGASWDADETELAPAHWHRGAEESGLRWAMDATLGLFHALVRAVIWVATTPLVLAIVVPVLIMSMLFGAMRRARETPAQAAEARPIETAAVSVADTKTRSRTPRRRRRRQSRRRGGWSMLIGQLRESIGFPDADTLRGSDFTAQRGNCERPAPKSA